MNRIKRIAAATAISTVVLAPTTASVALARPEPGPAPETSSLSKPKAQIEHEELLRINEQPSVLDDQASATSSSDAASVAWDTVGLAAFAGAVVGAGAVVAIRYGRSVPKQA